VAFRQQNESAHAGLWLMTNASISLLPTAPLVGGGAVGCTAEEADDRARVYD
jgi:hypothetical protein